MKNYQLLPQHYLKIAQQENNPYYNDFVKTFKILSNTLSTQQQKSLEQKLQLIGRGQFDEGHFVRIACETTVCAYFAELYSKNFQYECRCNSNNRKDVDCQFTDGKYTYNIEVKCPGLENYKGAKEAWPKIEMIGRFEPEGRKLVNKLMAIVNDSLVEQQNGWQYDLRKSLDNNMKSFLQEAHEKFPSVELTDMVNILVVCCDDMNDVQRWIHHLFQREGLFTEESFTDASTYNRVDIVILTNLFNRHYLFNGKNIQGNSWHLKDAFNLAFDNPLKKTDKISTMLNFLYKFPHYSYFLEDHLSEEGKEINEKNFGRAFAIRQFVPRLEELLSRVENDQVSFFA